MIREPREIVMRDPRTGREVSRVYDCVTLTRAEILERYGDTARRPMVRATGPSPGPALGMPGPLLIAACVAGGVVCRALEGGAS